MRNLLALAGLLLVGFAVIGWYQGWYTLQRKEGQSISIDVNTKKVQDDVNATKKKVGEVLQK